MAKLLSDPVMLGLLAVSAVVIVLLVLVVALWRKLRRFLMGDGPADLGDSILSISSDLSDLKAFRDELEKYLATVERRLKRSVQSVRTVRFNPWQGAGEGGNQSFAAAFMDEEGDGVVISSLYSRDHVSVFGKPLKKHSSEHELSEEERRAVEEAKKGLG
ncbi:MAG: DUF4446 family protein [Patescibacteria group bacterium]|nr:DUF4446 family protein [Patescibacteria group bacterium]